MSNLYNLTHLDIGDTPLIKAAPLPDLPSKQVMIVGAQGAKRVSFEEIAAIPVPEATYKESGTVSFNPCPYSDLITAARSIYTEVLDTEPLYETYAIAKNGDEFAGKLVYPYKSKRGTMHENYGISVVLRSSYNNNVAPSGADGQDTFICANGMMSGKHAWKARQTAGMSEAIVSHLRGSAGQATMKAGALIDLLDDWSEVPCADLMFYAYLGILRGRKVITPTLYSRALNYWEACTSGQLHDAHGDRTLASAFQSVTGALHSVVPTSRRTFGIGGAATAVTKAFASTGGSVAGIELPEFKLEDFAQFETV